MHMKSQRTYAPLLVLVILASMCSSCYRRPELKTLDTLSSVDHIARWDRFNDAGLRALTGNDLDQAERDFTRALIEADSCGLDNPRLGISLNNLATVYEKRQQYTLCMSYLSRAKDLFQKVNGSDDPAIAKVLRTQGRVYAETGNYYQAESLYLDAVLRMIKHRMPEAPQATREYAEVLRHLNRRKEADSFDKTARRMSEMESPGARR